MILLLGDWDDTEYDRFWDDKALNELRGAVLVHLPIEKLVHFVDIADELGELPWDVLKACRELVKRKLAVEGEHKQRQKFRRK